MAKRIQKQKLTQGKIVERNLALQTAFNQYLFDHPLCWIACQIAFGWSFSPGRPGIEFD